MRTIRVLVAAATLLLAGFVGQASGAPGDWPMDRQGPAHTGTNPDETVLSPATVGGLGRDWELPQCFVQNNPVVAGPTVLIDDSCGDTLYAASATTGRVRWLAETAAFGGTPAVDRARGLVFVASQPNLISRTPAGVEAFRLSDGHRVWFTRRTASDNAVTLAHGRVLVGTANGRVLSLDEVTGAVAWSTHIGSLITQATSVANGRVHFLAWNGDAYALSEATGAVLWRRHVTRGYREFSTPAVANGLVTFGTSKGEVMALSARTGATRWSFDTGAKEIVGSPAVAGSTLVILTESGRVLARNALTGAPLWRRDLPASFLTSPGIANGVVYVADNQVSGSFWALSLATGRTLLTRDGFRTCCATLSDPVVSHGALYIGEWDGENDAWLERYDLR